MDTETLVLVVEDEASICNFITAVLDANGCRAVKAGDERTIIGELEIDYGRRTVCLSGEKVHLTPVEYRILALLAQNAGKVLTHDYIMREIWSLYSGDSHTLRVNMANIRRKIEANPGEPRYILTEMGVGYRMVEEWP